MDKSNPNRYKKTAAITLVLIASVSVEGCTSTKQRRVHQNLKDCAEQWGKPELCEPVTDDSYPVGFYYGPYYQYRGGRYYYHRNYNSPPRAVPSSAGITNVNRGRGGNSPSVNNTRRGGFGSGAATPVFRGVGGGRGG